LFIHELSDVRVHDISLCCGAKKGKDIQLQIQVKVVTSTSNYEIYHPRVVTIEFRTHKTSMGGHVRFKICKW
jgi:hypothetical protein